MNQKANYGQDAPGITRAFLFVGTLLVGLGGLLLKFFGSGYLPLGVGIVLMIFGGVSLGFGLSMLAYGLKGKFTIRERMLGLIEWRGDEQVLDIGTGRGLLMIGAAKRLTTGKVIGIDLWNAADLSGNTAENTGKNIEIEGVADKVELLTGDARKMTFADESFDVILSLLCLHNIENVNERASACAEIARVLKPGGTVLIGDYILTGEYAKTLAEVGLDVGRPKPYLKDALGLMWILVATKKAGANL